MPEVWDVLAEFLGWEELEELDGLEEREVRGLLDLPAGIAGNSLVSAADCCGFLGPSAVAGFIGWCFFTSAFFGAEPFCLLWVVSLGVADVEAFASRGRGVSFTCGVGVLIWRG